MRPVNRTLPAALAALLLSACNQAPPAEPAGTVDLSAWASETIQLPPGFAPGLPPGLEELRFAPGMYDAGAEDYWSYVYVLRFEESAGGEDWLRDVLEQYYDGLITAVAGSRGLTLEGEPAEVTLRPGEDGKQRADVDLVDAFVTGAPLTIHMELELVPSDAGTQVRAAVSPQPPDHPVWSDLRAALATLP